MGLERDSEVSTNKSLQSATQTFFNKVKSWWAICKGSKPGSILKHSLFNTVNYCETETSGFCVPQNPGFKLWFPWQQHILINNIFLPCFVIWHLSTFKSSKCFEWHHHKLNETDQKVAGIVRQKSHKLRVIKSTHPSLPPTPLPQTVIWTPKDLTRLIKK